MKQTKEDTIFDRDTIRNSGVELLKIVAIMLIIISHVTQTFVSENPYIPYQDYVLDVSSASTDIQHFLLVFLRGFGGWGNTIFFVCSAWFLLKSSKYNKKKWLFMLVEVWVISMLILIITYGTGHGDISGKIVIKSILPTIFASNWYITCYLLFYPIHPLLNLVINRMNRRELFRLSGAMFILYFCFVFVKGDLFFCSPIITWVDIYFIMSYIQLYMKDFVDNMKYNIILFFAGLLGYVGILVITNYLGFHFAFMYDKMLRWVSNNNPFLLAMTIGLFNVVRNIQFKSRFINYISSLSILIYVIHENIILRTYYRPKMADYVYHNLGYGHIVWWVFIVAVIIFVLGVFCSIIYEKTLRRFVCIFSSSLYKVLKKLYLAFETYVLMFLR